MASDHKKQKADENYYRSTADTAAHTADEAITHASTPDPNTQRIMDHATALDNWQYGVDAAGNKVPIDVRNMPGNDVNMALFQDALKVHDAGRVGGRGGTMGDTVNPNFVASLDKEQEMERHLAASGALEGSVDNAIANKDVALGNLSAIGEGRQMNVAGLRNNAYQSAAQRDLAYRLRPKQPNFFRELAMQFAQGTGQGAAMAAAG